jgi:hypothetical protein
LSDARRDELWITDAGVPVLVVSSTVYNEIPSEPTIIVVPVFDSEPDAGFGVDLGAGWAAPGLTTSLRKARLNPAVLGRPGALQLRAVLAAIR